MYHKKPIYLALIAISCMMLIGILFYALRGPSVPKTVDIPIVLYHHIDDMGDGGSCIAEETFLSHLDAIRDAGYEAVSFQDVSDYVLEGEPLPKKPIVITFDDGYLSNYEIAWPALAERGMVGTIFVIGSSVGKTTYKDTDVPIIPHFSYEQAREMIGSGTIAIQSHTYDMHQYRPLEADGGREGVLPRGDEENEAYRAALYQDLSTAVSEIEQNTGEAVQVLAYPFGLYTEDSERISAEAGITVTLTTKMETAHLVHGEPDSLRLLGRYSIDDCTPEELLSIITS